MQPTISAHAAPRLAERRAGAASRYRGAEVRAGPVLDVSCRCGTDLDVRPGPGSSAGGLPVDGVAVSPVQAGVGRIETALDVDDVAAGVRCRPGQVAPVIVAELLNAHLFAPSPWKCPARSMMTPPQPPLLLASAGPGWSQG